MSGESRVLGYVLKEADGRSYRWGPGYLFTIKAMGDEMGDDIAFIEFATEKGKEPPGLHAHQDEDEIFYVLSGELTVACGEDSLDAGPGDFVFLPANVPHGYTIRSDGLVHMLVVTVCHDQDGRHFGRDIEQTGEPVSRDVVLRYMEELRAR
jgi:quercetin dioxygenase-like cupin family protein